MNKHAWVFPAALALVAVWGWAAPIRQVTPQAVRAQRFELVDKDGIVRSAMAIDAHGQPSLQIYGRNGKERVIFGLDADENPYLRMHDRLGMIRVLLNVGTEGQDSGTVFQLTDRKSQATAEITVAEGKFLLYMHAKDSQRASIHLPDGRPTLILQKGTKSRTLTP